MLKVLEEGHDSKDDAPSMLVGLTNVDGMIGNISEILQLAVSVAFYVIFDEKRLFSFKIIILGRQSDILLHYWERDILREKWIPMRAQMSKKTENMDIVTANPLVESGVEKMIQVIRGKQVLLDRDLAALYGVETRRINEQVKRNIERFPEDFCFQLDKTEFENWKSQFAISNSDKMGLRKIPYAFTEQGVAMLSSVLKSESAIRVNIAIMRAFVQLRHFMMGNGGFVNRLSNVEAKILALDLKNVVYDKKIDILFEAMDRGELKSKGIFYESQEFDAYAFACGLIRQAQKRIVLVDNYVDETTLLMMLKRNQGVSVTIYTYDKSKIFELDLQKYNAQYIDCPIEILPNTDTHDRFLFIDNIAYHFGASLKDLGKKTFFFSKEDFTLDEVLKKNVGTK